MHFNSQLFRGNNQAAAILRQQPDCETIALYIFLLTYIAVKVQAYFVF